MKATIFIAALLAVCITQMGSAVAQSEENSNCKGLLKRVPCDPTIDQEAEKPCGDHGRCFVPFRNTSATNLTDYGTYCKCELTYGTRPSDRNPCEYELRSQEVSFLLSVFLGYFGMDWWYQSQNHWLYILVGFLKLLLTVVPISVFLGCSDRLGVLMWEWQMRETYKSYGHVHRTKLQSISFYITLICMLLALIWWVVDFVLIGLTNNENNLKLDGNGVCLQRF